MSLFRLVPTQAFGEGVRQREIVSPILFSMYLNDIKREYILKGAEGPDIGVNSFYFCMLKT